ncbi:MAG: hypothetical protein AB7P99_04060 [Vicinamibacterales bacterium]
MEPQGLLRQILFLFGVGFLIANLKVVVDLLRFRRRRRAALLTWEAPKPAYYGFSLALGVLLGLMLAFKIFVQRRPPDQLFGEAMMFVYYGYAMPLSTRILRGFYEDGVWADTGFMRWGQISAVTWKEEGVAPQLVLVSHFKAIARRLVIPGPLYGEARRLMRDRVKAHDIHIGGTGLDLGSREDADSV